MINLVCKSVGMAMGIAVVVLSMLNQVEVVNAVVMLGIGVACLGISTFTK